jgi:hypothetical protein
VSFVLGCLLGMQFSVVVLFHSGERRQQCSSQGFERGCSEKVPTATGFVSENDRVGSLLTQKQPISMLKSQLPTQVTPNVRRNVVNRMWSWFCFWAKGINRNMSIHKERVRFRS